MLLGIFSMKMTCYDPVHLFCFDTEKAPLVLSFVLSCIEKGICMAIANIYYNRLYNKQRAQFSDHLCHHGHLLLIVFSYFCLKYIVIGYISAHNLLS